MININKLKAILFLSVCMFLSSCGGGESGDGLGESWKYLGDMKAEKGVSVSVYIDTDSIEVDGNIRKFWIRYMARKTDDKDDEGYVRQLGYWEVDCFDRKLFRLKEEYYSPSSKIIGSSDERKQEEYSDDQSLGAKMSYAACRYAGNK